MVPLETSRHRALLGCTLTGPMVIETSNARLETIRTGNPRASSKTDRIVRRLVALSRRDSPLIGRADIGRRGLLLAAGIEPATRRIFTCVFLLAVERAAA